MSRLLRAVGNDDFTLTLEFENGNKIIWNMRHMLKTFMYAELNNSDVFKNVKVDGMTVLWPDAPHTWPVVAYDVLFSLRGVRRKGLVKHVRD